MELIENNTLHQFLVMQKVSVVIKYQIDSISCREGLVQAISNAQKKADLFSFPLVSRIKELQAPALLWHLKNTPS